MIQQTAISGSPICPLHIYFEGANINPDKCDYDNETHSCNEQCNPKSPRIIIKEQSNDM